MHEKHKIITIIIFLLLILIFVPVSTSLEETKPKTCENPVYQLIPSHSTLVSFSEPLTAIEDLTNVSTANSTTNSKWYLVRYTRTGAVYSNGSMSKIETSIGTLNAWNGTAWVPYIFENHSSYYVLRSGWITAEIYPDYGYATYYDANYTKKIVHAERWHVEVWREDQKKWDDIGVGTYLGSYYNEIILNESGVYLTLCFKVSGKGKLNVTYILPSGKPIKHRVVFQSLMLGNNTFRIVQTLDEIVATSVRTQNGEYNITSTVHDNSLWFEFISNETICFQEWPLDPSYNGTVIDVKQQNQVRAKFYFCDESFMISKGETIEIDPLSATAYVSSVTLTDAIHVSGSTSDLNTDDGVYYKVAAAKKTDPDTGETYYIIGEVRFTVSADLPSDASVTGVDIYFYSHSSAAVSRYIRAKDYVANAWDTLDYAQWGTSDGSDDQVFTGLGPEYWDSANGIGEVRLEAARASDLYYGYFDMVKYVVYYNVPPSISSAEITNMDDTDNMYAKYKTYTWKVTVTDDDGYSDIDQVHFILAQGTTERCGVYWDDTTGINKRSTNAGWIILGSPSGQSTGVGSTLTIEFYVWIDWDFGDEDDLEIRCWANDTYGHETGWVTMQTDYVDVDTSVTVRGFTVDDSRVDVGATVTFTGNVCYGDSPSNIQVPSSEIDYVQILVDTTVKGTQQDTNSFSISVTTSTSVTKETYHPKVVLNNGEVWDLTTITQDVITDKLTVTLSATDYRTDIDTTVTISWEIVRQYDSTTVTNFSITILRDGVSWYTGSSGSSTDSLSTVGSHTYNCSSVTDNTYNLTVFETNTITVIWDRIEVYAYSVSDTHVNVSDSVLVWVKLRYDYDDTIFDSSKGTVYIEDIAATWDTANQYWYVVLSYSEVTTLSCDIPSSVTDNTYDLTVIYGAVVIDIIWDRIMIVYFEQTPGASYLSVGTEVNFTGYVYYEATNQPIGAQTDAVKITVDGTTIYYVSTDSNGYFIWSVPSTYYSSEGRHTFRFDPINSPDGITVEKDYIEKTVEWSELRATAIDWTWSGKDWATGFSVTFTFFVTFGNGTAVTEGKVYLYTNATGVFQLVAEKNVTTEGYVEIKTFIIERINYMHFLFNFSSPTVIDDNIYEETIYVPGELLYFDPSPSWDIPDPDVPNQIRIIAGTNRRDCTFYIYIQKELYGVYDESVVRIGIVISFTSPGTNIIKIEASDDIGTISTTFNVTIRAVRGTIILSIHDQQGRSPIEVLKILINGTESYGELLEPGDRIKLERFGDNYIYTHLVYNITIIHWRFVAVLWQKNVSFPEGKVEVLVQADIYMYSWKFQNQGETPIWVSVRRNGGEWSKWVYSWEIVEFWLFPGTYTLMINYTEVQSDYYVIMNGTYTSTTFTITRDYAMILSGTTLQDVFGNVNELYSYVENVNETITNQVISVNITIKNVNSSLTNQVINVDIHLDNVNTSIAQQLVEVLTDIENTNSTLFTQTLEILNDIENTNSTLYNQTIEVLIEIRNTNRTLYSKTIKVLNTLYDLKEVHFIILTAAKEAISKKFVDVYANGTRLSELIYYTRSEKVYVEIYDLWDRYVFSDTFSVTSDNHSIVVVLNFTKLVVCNPNSVKVTLSLAPTNYTAMSWVIDASETLTIFCPYGNYTYSAIYAGKTLTEDTIELSEPIVEKQIPYVETPSEPEPTIKTGNLLIPIGIIIIIIVVSWTYSLRSKRIKERQEIERKIIERKRTLLEKLLETESPSEKEIRLREEMLRKRLEQEVRRYG